MNPLEVARRMRDHGGEDNEPVDPRDRSWYSRPKFVRRVNGAAVVVWLALGYPTLVYWKQSVLWVALMSLWANIVSHYTAWLAARVEVRQEKVEIANVEQDGDTTTAEVTETPTG